MQAFLPYPDFVKSVKVLDRSRLGKQRVEASQMLDAIILTMPEAKQDEWLSLGVFGHLDERIKKIRNGENIRIGWKNHVATNIWKGYEYALIHYRNLAIIEWVRRGYKNTMKLYPENNSMILPPIIGREDFHISHQSNLIRKYPSFYAPIFVGVPDNLEYVWK